MTVSTAIISRRTRRKFLDKPVPHEKLLSLVEYARYAPMAANIQALKYAIAEGELARQIFPYTKWSGYEPEKSPTDVEKPPAYIAILGDTEIKSNASFETDAGAAGTVILLAAEELGLGACWLGSINREEISSLLKLDSKLNLLYLIAIGYSEQKARAINTSSDIKYFTDKDKILNVPKRTLDDILIEV